MRLLFLVFTFFAISLNISYAKDSLQLGGYKADNCDVIIFLKKQNELFSYRVESEELNFSGQVSFSDNNLIFSKFRNYIDKNFYDIAGDIVSNDRFIIQNYGNSMNMYNNIPDCEDKYLEYKLFIEDLAKVKYKSILYLSPDKKTNMYLIKGDKVKVLKDKLDDKGRKWYFINYKGKKEINMWIKADSVDLN